MICAEYQKPVVNCSSSKPYAKASGGMNSKVHGLGNLPDNDSFLCQTHNQLGT